MRLIITYAFIPLTKFAQNKNRQNNPFIIKIKRIRLPVIIISTPYENSTIIDTILQYFICHYGKNIKCPASGDYFLIGKAKIPFHGFQKWDQCCGIRGLWSQDQPYNIFTVYAMLEIISGLELSVPYSVFFHPHKSRVVVSFGITVACSTNMQLFRIFF